MSTNMSNSTTTRSGHSASRSTLLGRATNRAMRELRRRHYPEYYQIYSNECDLLGIGKAHTPVKIMTAQIADLTNEVNKLKELLKHNNIEVIEFDLRRADED